MWISCNRKEWFVLDWVSILCLQDFSDLCWCLLQHGEHTEGDAGHTGRPPMLHQGYSDQPGLRRRPQQPGLHTQGGSPQYSPKNVCYWRTMPIWSLMRKPYRVLDTNQLMFYSRTLEISQKPLLPTEQPLSWNQTSLMHTVTWLIVYRWVCHPSGLL